MNKSIPNSRQIKCQHDRPNKKNYENKEKVGIVFDKFIFYSAGSINYCQYPPHQYRVCPGKWQNISTEIT